MRELEITRSVELARAERDAPDSKSRATVQTTPQDPKLPYFDQDKDNMDSYLARFERYAEVQGWQKGQWSLHLSSLLKGKALDVYSRLALDDANDYTTLKTDLLKMFDLTADGFRKRFKTGRPEQGGDIYPVHK